MATFDPGPHGPDITTEQPYRMEALENGRFKIIFRQEVFSTLIMLGGADHVQQIINTLNRAYRQGWAESAAHQENLAKENEDENQR